MGAVHNYERRVERAELILEKSGISDVNKALIRRFVEFKTAEKVKAPRIAKYLGTLRLIVERYLEDRDFTALTKEGLISVVAKIERCGLSDWSKRDYVLAIKIFYKWLGREELVSWIKIGNPGNKLLPEDLLTQDDVEAMIDAASTVRDKALVACLYEGGFRIGELGGLTLKDVSFDRYGAVVMVNGKTGMRPVRLIWSMPYLAQWLEVHPFRDDHSSPLWIAQGVGSRTKGMMYWALRQQLKRIAERAGVKHKVNPHNFRHSRATHLSKEITDSLRNRYLGLVSGSKMGRVYEHLSGQDLDEKLLQMYGLPFDDGREEKLKTVQCPHCRSLNTTGARVCNNCRMPLTIEEVISKEEKVMEFAAELMDLTAKSPEFAALLKKYTEKDTP